MDSRQRQPSTEFVEALPDLVPLPDEVVRLLEAVDAPPILCAHLRLVHDVAIQLTSWMQATYAGLTFDPALAAFGAATHDIGKGIHQHELSGPGSAHEAAGQALLIAQGVRPASARFAVTHNDWSADAIAIEDLLVAVADKVWKAKREVELETVLVSRISSEVASEQWQVFAAVDEELDRIAALADERLAFQRRWQSA